MKKDKGTRGYTGHDSLCIGVLHDPEHPETRKFYANKNYLLRQTPVELPEPPKFSSSISVGLTTWIREVSIQSGLADDLTKAFGDNDTSLIMDMAAYMLSKESAVMQHFPAWARDHELFSEDIPDDTFLGQFLRNNLTLPKIKQFREYAYRQRRFTMKLGVTGTGCRKMEVIIHDLGHKDRQGTVP